MVKEFCLSQISKNSLRKGAWCLWRFIIVRSRLSGGVRGSLSLRLLRTVPGRNSVTGKRELPMTSPGKAASCTGKFCCRNMRQRNIWTGRRFGSQLQKQRKNPMRSLQGRLRWRCRLSFPKNYSLKLSGNMFRIILSQRACVRILPSTIRGMATRTLTSSLQPDQLRRTAHGAQRRKRIMQGMKTENASRLLIKRSGCRSWVSEMRNSGNG